MPLFSRFTKNRCDPGILLFNKKQQVIFSNQVAIDILEGARKAPRLNGGRQIFPPEISEFYKEMRRRSHTFAPNTCMDAVYLKKIVKMEGDLFEMKGYIIADAAMPATLFLVLIEKFGIRAGVNTKERCAFYHITRKQFEVTQLLAKGLTNKEIANNLNITETTVKDHIRKIMAKVNTTTRAGIVSKILSISDHEMLEQGEKRENVYPFNPQTRLTG